MRSPHAQPIITFIKNLVSPAPRKVAPKIKYVASPSTKILTSFISGHVVAANCAPLAVPAGINKCKNSGAPKKNNSAIPPTYAYPNLHAFLMTCTLTSGWFKPWYLLTKI